MIYFDLFLTAFAATYIVDVSGFTDAWREGLARVLHIRRLRALPPFDCGKCAVFWACVLLSLFRGELTVGTFAFSCLLSLLSLPLGQAMLAGREALLKLTEKL